MRRFTSLTTAAAIVITSLGVAATPAEARHRYGGWGYRDRDHISAGEVLGGLAVIGAIAAIATAVSKDRNDRREPRYEPPYPDDRYRDVPRYEPDDGGDPGNGAAGRGEAETRAADACSWAVEAEMGDDARVDRIDGTEPDNGGWYVTGIASRLGGDTRSFSCSYRGGRVVDVTLGN